MEAVNAKKPKTWLRYKKGMCDTCFATCCHKMPVEASIPDLIRLGYLTEEDASTNLTGAARRLKREGIIQSFRPRSLVFILSQKANGDCSFLNAARQCTVYLKRPEICRQFPKIGPNPGSCPYLAKDK